MIESKSKAAGSGGLSKTRAAMLAPLLGAILFSASLGAQPAPLPAGAAQPAGPAGEPAPLESPAAIHIEGAAPPAPLGSGRAEPQSMPAPSASKLLPVLLPRDLSPWGMFLSAVPAVKAVMVGLTFASFVTWTVWLAKTVELWRAKRLARCGTEQLASAQSLREAQKSLAKRASPISHFAAAAEEELRRSDRLAQEGVKERAAALIARLEAQAGRSAARGTGVLATIGATAPFVGLFGTVWGIMDSFIGISKTNTTNLAVVAPGIAEALLATALGLVAAIPAVVMYNAFARSIAAYRAQLGDAAAEVLRHLSRDLDREAVSVSEKKPAAALRALAE